MNCEWIINSLIILEPSESLYNASTHCNRWNLMEHYDPIIVVINLKEWILKENSIPASKP